LLPDNARSSIVRCLFQSTQSPTVGHLQPDTGAALQSQLEKFSRGFLPKLEVEF